MSGYTVLRHSQHEGYYSPNNTANKATPYIFDTVVKSSDGRQIGMRFKGTGDREWVIIYVPSTDFTPTYNNVIKLINDNKDISNRKVVIRENEKAKAARIVTNFFNSPSISGNEKMTSYVKKPQYLKHSEDLDIIDVSDDYLEHHGVKGMKWGVINEDEKKTGHQSVGQSSSNSTNSSRNNSGGHSYYSPNTGNSSQYNLNAKRNVNSSRNASGSSKDTVWDLSQKPICNSTGIEMPVQNGRTRQGVIFDISGNALKRVLDSNGDVVALARDSVINRLREFQDKGINIYLTEKQVDMIVWRLVYAAQNNWKKQYYNIRHSLFTEVYDMDDYLEHHGILGMKWGVRRYQNEDGSLTDAGRKRYGVKRIKQEASSIKDPSDKQKYLMLEKQKATDKGTFHMSAAAAGGAGLAAGALTKAAIANAVASGASSVYVPVLGLAMTTPVGQIASIAALTAGTAGTIYSIYREKKINQLMLDNVAEASKQPLKVDVSKKPQSSNGMYVMAKPGELPASTRVTGKEESDFWKSLANNQAFLDEAGHREAAKYGLDKGDNYKVFIDAARGDEEANRIIEEWKKMKK